MVLPLYLAITPGEMGDGPSLPRHWGWMACHFSPASSGLCDLPDTLSPGAMLILNDRIPCRNHDPERIAEELAEAAARLRCGSVLLDFEREAADDAIMVANALFQALPCPVAAPPGFAKDSGQAVFLPPCPLHVPLADYLQPWQAREVWLEAALQQQTVTVTPDGTRYGPIAPADRQEGGRSDDVLHCRCMTDISEEQVRFTLFDTPETLTRKLDHAASLGVARAVGLYQELRGK